MTVAGAAAGAATYLYSDVKSGQVNRKLKLRTAGAGHSPSRNNVRGAFASLPGHFFAPSCPRVFLPALKGYQKPYHTPKGDHHERNRFQIRDVLKVEGQTVVFGKGQVVPIGGEAQRRGEEAAQDRGPERARPADSGPQGEQAPGKERSLEALGQYPAERQETQRAANQGTTQGE
jgi:hypothetical protein